MKVLHVIPSLDVRDGGPTAAMTDMVSALSSVNVELAVATTADRSVTLRRPAEWPADVSLVSFRRWFVPYKIAPLLVVWLWNNVRRFDVIHIHACFSFSSTAAACISRLRGVPYVVRPLGTLDPYGLSERRPLLKRASYALIEGPYLRAAKAIHCTSANELRAVAALERRAHGVEIPLAARAPKFESRAVMEMFFPQLAGRRVILFLSRVDPKKNLDALLSAYERVAPAFPDSTLVVAGDGDTAYVDRLKGLWGRLGERVVWAGHVSGEAKASLLSNAYCFVLPSFAENFGIAAAEALSYGLPAVLAEGVAISSEVVRYRGGLVTSTTAESVAAALSRLLSDVTLRDQLSINATRLAQERFGSARLGHALQSLYRQLL